MPLIRRSYGFIALAIAGVVAACILGCWDTSLQIYDVSRTLIAFGVITGIFLPIPAYWHEKHRPQRRDCALILPYALLIWLFIPIPFLIAARLDFPLRDNLFAAFDHSLGINIGSLVSWTKSHGLVRISNASYNFLYLYLAAAVLVPALLGKREGQRFLLANLVALAIGIPCVAFLPAIGPWYSEHFAVGVSQQGVEAQVLALRSLKTYPFSVLADGSGIVAFPSFHVLWAVLSASSFWSFRWLRPPLVLLSTMVILSTMTTGFHYFADVLGGLVLSAISLYAAEAILRRSPVWAEAAPPSQSTAALS